LSALCLTTVSPQGYKEELRAKSIFLIFSLVTFFCIKTKESNERARTIKTKMKIKRTFNVFRKFVIKEKTFTFAELLAGRPVAKRPADVA